MLKYKQQKKKKKKKKIMRLYLPVENVLKFQTIT